ncbi:hypothetical protein CN524_03405 [Bacillus sp. AFS019443]|nr:hypothetical protein CN524_03405 [Bacillus sp. AFS019443]
MEELIVTFLLGLFAERLILDPFVEYIEQKSLDLSIFTYVKTTQAMDVAVEWLRVLKVVAFSYVPFTH